LYTFAGGFDGGDPQALIRDSVGNLYGTTAMGGTFTNNCSFAGGQGCGTVYKFDTHHKETVLHSFAGTTDGQLPTMLIRDSKGNIYGCANTGGASFVGTLYKIDASGKATVLYTFAGGTGTNGDGANPNSVVRDSAGNLFGTTGYGGTANSGTVFKLTPALKETILYSFASTSSTDGQTPGTLLDVGGTLYGTTIYGGTMLGNGTVFKMDQNGNETILHNFNGGDGSYPASAIVRDGAGNIYGTTLQGGQYGSGTVYKLDTGGNLTTLHSFDGTDGEYPQGNLVRDSAGNLYGATSRGGTYGWGTVFKLAPQ